MPTPPPPYSLSGPFADGGFSAGDPPLSTAEWQALDRAHHMHPFTDHGDLNAKGTRVIRRAYGVTIEEQDGHTLLDGMAGLWCVNVGYGREDLVAAAAEQMARLPYYNTFFQCTTGPVTALAAVLAEITPDSITRFFFGSSGSESNDTLIRVARHYWAVQGQPERTILIARKNAYHGSTLGGTSLSGMGPMRAQGGPLVPDIHHIDQPYWYGEGEGQSPTDFALARARALEEAILALGPERVAAFVAEPVQGAGGVIVPPPGYWPEIVRICRTYGILLAVDEVICGFGRTGSWFGSQTYGLEPDLMTLAKGMTSGYQPLSALGVSERVAAVLAERGGEFFHGYTYAGHPVACAVALANIAVIRKEGLVERVATDTGPYLQQRLQDLCDHPLVGHAEGVGLVGGLALVRAKTPRTFFPADAPVGLICRDACIRNGLVMRAVGNRMVVAPPLIITRAEIDTLFERAWKSLDDTRQALGL